MQMPDKERVDALCQRQCAFALYKLPGEQEWHFCMQQDGGTSRPDAERTGFHLCTFSGESLMIAEELTAPPAPQNFLLLPPRQPATPATTHEEYLHLFEAYSGLLQGGQMLEKIVLARTEDVPVSSFSPAATLQEAAGTAPLAFNALVHTPRHGTWLCSTPELLLQGAGEEWQTMALAGTRPLGTTAAWDDKNLREHACVVQHITDCISPLASEYATDGPHTVPAGRLLEHLCTHIPFCMPRCHLPELLRTLPPTPAVSGYPVAEARAVLTSRPDIDRSCYAGYLGPVSPDIVQLFVTLRCMQIYPGICRLYAGGGIMPESDAESEWQETIAKMQTMRQLLGSAASQPSTYNAGR